jgi:hypothetical protein
MLLSAALLAACGAPAISETPAPIASKERAAMSATQFTSINGKPLDLTPLARRPSWS